MWVVAEATAVSNLMAEVVEKAEDTPVVSAEGRVVDKRETGSD